MKAFAVALLGLFALTPVAEARTRLSGAGASFPSKIYSRWFYDLAKEKGPRVNYQAVGSGSGRKDNYPRLSAGLVQGIKE